MSYESHMSTSLGLGWGETTRTLVPWMRGVQGFGRTDPYNRSLLDALNPRLQRTSVQVVSPQPAEVDILCPWTPIWSTWMPNVDQMGAHGHKMSTSANQGLGIQQETSVWDCSLKSTLTYFHLPMDEFTDLHTTPSP